MASGALGDAIRGRRGAKTLSHRLDPAFNIQMRRHNLLSGLICALLLAFVASACHASKAEELYDKAMRAKARAERSAKTADKNDAYDDAIKWFGQVVDKHDDTPQAVMAAYEIGEIHETAKGKYRNQLQAYESYKSLAQQYKPAGKFNDEKLEESFQSSEISVIKDYVNRAEKGRDRLALELDRENSKDWKYQILDFFVGITGRISWFSYWFAIIAVTVIVKIIITPLTKAQFKAMKEMQKVAPLVKEIQAKHKGDQKTIGEKTMALYKEHRINPFASCLPLLIQMPILFLLFYMIKSYEFQFAKGTFLWIGSPLSHLYSFAFSGKQLYITAANLSEPDIILVVLYLISMYVSTKMSAVDPTQADQQKMMAIMMPVMFAFIFATFPAAFLLYWLVFNVIQTIQQYLILHGGPEPATVPAAPPPPDEPESGDDRVRRPRRRR